MGRELEATTHSYELSVRSYALSTIYKGLKIKIRILTPKLKRDLSFVSRSHIFGVKSKFIAEISI